MSDVFMHLKNIKSVQTSWGKLHGLPEKKSCSISV